MRVRHLVLEFLHTPLDRSPGVAVLLFRVPRVVGGVDVVGENMVSFHGDGASGSNTSAVPGQLE